MRRRNVYDLVTSTGAFLSDVDGFMAPTEPVQESGWVTALASYTEGDPDRDAIRLAVNTFVRETFRTGNFERFMIELFELVHGYPPDPIEMAEAFDREISAKRNDILLRACREGRIQLNPGIRELFEDATRRKTPCGIYTNSPQALAEPMLEILFGRRAFNRLIPRGHRLYGDTLGVRPDGTKRLRKPSSEGWQMLAEMIGVPFDRSVVFEDRLPYATQAVRDGVGGAVWAQPVSRNAARKSLRQTLGPELIAKVLHVPSPQFLAA